MRYSDIIEGKLTKKDLIKDNKRLANFIRKYETGQLFVALGGDKPTIKLKKDDEVLANLKQGIIPDKFATHDGRVVRLTSLEKTSEFGGKGAGFSTRDEDAALGSIGEMFAKLKGDKAEIQQDIGGRIVNVAKFVTTPGTPKSDFHAVDASGNEVAWISHKKGSRAKDFGQWGGMSDREMKTVYERFPEAKEEILAFAKTVIDMTDGQIPRATTYAREIKNGILRGIAIYGIGFKGEPSKQNVDLVLQGDPVFKGNKLVSTGPHHSNGERVEGEFEPVLMAMYKGDRDNFGVKGARFSVYPKGGRKITKYI